jgi:hypothetical protein
MKVWVLIIDTKHGTDVSAHASKPAADRALFNYCDQFWSQEFSEDRPDDDNLVRAYWDRQSERGEDWYKLEECEVDGNTTVPPVFIPENSRGVKPGYYTRPDIVRLLRKHSIDQPAVAFIADMLE